MKSTITNSTAGKEYRWKQDAADGFRSYSYAASSIGMSDPSWNYAKIENPNKAENEAYIFTDSSTGQPSARRGNLYNFTAATLGSLLSKNGEAVDSICPRGWQLPITTTNVAESVSAIDMTNKSWAKLLRTYDIAKMDGDNIVGANRSKEWPLEYLPTGYYYYNNGYVSNRATSGNWWVGVARSSGSGYGLNSNSDSIYAQNNLNRGSGVALRCIAKSRSGYEILKAFLALNY